MSHGNKSSHEDNRKKVCGPCGRKIQLGKKKIEQFLITEKTEKLVKKFVSEDFDLMDEKYPLSICTTCYLTLLDAEKNKFQRPLQKMPNYAELKLSKETRTNVNSCNCYICVTGRFKGHVKVERGKGHKRDLKNNITDDSLRLVAADKLPVSFTESKATKNTLQMCSKCFQEIGKGIKHVCKISNKNVLKIIDQLPERNKEQIVTTILKKKIESIIPTTKSKSPPNITLNLSTGGTKSKIVLNPGIQRNISFDEESLDNFRTNIGLSSNQMKKITNFIRCKVGRKSIPAYYTKHTSGKSKILIDIYKHAVHYFDCDNSSSKQKEKLPRPVVYADAEELLDAVIEHRKIQGNVIIKVLADGGQGSFKISLTILPENYSPTSESTFSNDFDSNENDCSVYDQPKELNCKRKLYSEGGVVSKRGKLTSVNRLILLCVVPQIKESYDNVKLLFELTKINNIPFKFVSDFKLLLIVNGQQTASAMFPCPYCFIKLDYLKQNPYINYSNHDALIDHTENGNQEILKTYGDLKADYNKFLLIGGDKKLSRESRSTINLPLFDEDDDVCVLQKCIVPELHVLQGLVNHLFWNGLVPLLGNEKALLWPQKLNLISKHYHGDAFEGNACRKLLKEADQLNDVKIYEKVGYFKIVPYIVAYKAMNKVVDCCFTSGKIEGSVDLYISELANALASIENISETLKIHVILAHIKDSLKFIENGYGLGFWSEQSGESVHREFLKFWERYKVTNVYHESYAPRLHKAVAEFSSLHL